jgi:hypothetical protein
MEAWASSPVGRTKTLADDHTPRNSSTTALVMTARAGRPAPPSNLVSPGSYSHPPLDTHRFLFQTGSLPPRATSIAAKSAMGPSVQQPATTESDKKMTVPVHRVAVIAVHGVGYTEPGATVRHLADLLLGLGRLKLSPKTPGGPQTPWGPPAPPYSGFHTQPIQVPLKAAPVSHPEAARQRTVEVIANAGKTPGFLYRLWHSVDERRGYVADVLADQYSTRTPAQIDTDLEDRARLGHEFMRAQLAGYVSEPEGKSYSTIRLETERTADATSRTVHLYEAYWADLARPQNSFLSFLIAFYQLLLHLGSLSRIAVDYATVEHHDKPSWRWHTGWQGSAVRFLVLPIPILNIYLLLAGLSVLPLELRWNHSLSGAFVLGVMVLSALLLWPRFRGAPRHPLLWIGLLAAAFVAGAFAGYLLIAGHVLSADALLAIEWWLVGGGLLYMFVIKPYDNVRRGGAGVGLALFIFCFLCFLYCLKQSASYPYPIEQASFWSMQLIMTALILAWAGLLLSAFIAWLLNFECQRVLPQDDAHHAMRARARSALRTGRLTLAVSASLFLVLTMFLWAGAYNFTRKQLHLHSHVQVTQPPLPAVLAPVFHAIVPSLGEAERWTGQHPHNKEEALDIYASALMLITTTAGLPIILLGSGIALALLVWAVVPSLLGDPVHFTNLQSRHLGNWLSRGLDSTRAITFLLWHSVFTVSFVFGTLDFAYSHGWLDPSFFLYTHMPWLLPPASLLNLLMDKMTGDSLHMLTFVGGWLAVSGAVVAATSYQKGRVVLDIILDVDNYLRTSPLDRAPRARIAERYTSLLRYIASEKDPTDPEGKRPYYTSVVIASHSLGAVISADLLQYLKREGEVEPDPALASLGFTKRSENEGAEKQTAAKPATSIYLFTFGNPLRQLLNRFFPHLYWWIREEPDNGLSPFPDAADKLPAINHGDTPEPAKLGLEHWVNAYRSGDFVGRALWLNGWFDRTKGGPANGAYDEELAIAEDDSRSEVCIGQGGHNDYWNRTAPDMAHILDRIICA